MLLSPPCASSMQLTWQKGLLLGFQCYPRSTLGPHGAYWNSATSSACLPPYISCSFQEQRMDPKGRKPDMAAGSATFGHKLLKISIKFYPLKTLIETSFCLHCPLRLYVPLLIQPQPTERSPCLTPASTLNLSSFTSLVCRKSDFWGVQKIQPCPTLV